MAEPSGNDGLMRTICCCLHVNLLLGIPGFLKICLCLCQSVSKSTNEPVIHLSISISQSTLLWLLVHLFVCSACQFGLSGLLIISRITFQVELRQCFIPQGKRTISYLAALITQPLRKMKGFDLDVCGKYHMHPLIMKSNVRGLFLPAMKSKRTR